MFGTEVASAVLASEGQKCFFSTFLAYHCFVFTRFQFFEGGACDVYVFLFQEVPAPMFALGGIVVSTGILFIGRNQNQESPHSIETVKGGKVLMKYL
jgi:hypothetical protein